MIVYFDLWPNDISFYFGYSLLSQDKNFHFGTSDTSWIPAENRLEFAKNRSKSANCGPEFNIFRPQRKLPVFVFPGLGIDVYRRRILCSVDPAHSEFLRILSTVVLYLDEIVWFLKPFPRITPEVVCDRVNWDDRKHPLSEWSVLVRDPNLSNSELSCPIKFPTG